MKERIIGAAVLVVFVVLVVPIFLDGPPDEAEIVSQSVLLPGQEEQKTQTVVLDRDRTEPVPAATQAAQPQPEPAREEPAPERSAPQAAERSEPPKPVVEPVRQPEPDNEPARSTPEPAAASTTGMWAVQLGSFSNKDNAERMASTLRKQGYAAFISEVSTANGKMHRVRVGPQKDRPSAEQMAARLAKVDHEGKVVPHP